MYRWKKKNTSETGAANRIANAAKSDHGVWPNGADHLVQGERQRVALARVVQEDRHEVELGPAGDEAEERR